MHDFVDQQKVINIAIAIILAILAFIVPAAIIYPAKSSFITTQAEEIGTSAWALLTGGIGLLALSGVFLILGVMGVLRKQRDCEARLFVREDTPFYTGKRMELLDWALKQKRREQ